jgi:hypothetical protein
MAALEPWFFLHTGEVQGSIPLCDCRLTTPIFITKCTIYCLVTSKAYAACDTAIRVVMRTVKAAPVALLAQLLLSRSFD